MEIATLPALRRTALGRNALRKLRADGHIPAVIYGGGKDNLSLSLEGETFERLHPAEGLRARHAPKQSVDARRLRPRLACGGLRRRGRLQHRTERERLGRDAVSCPFLGHARVDRLDERSEILEKPKDRLALRLSLRRRLGIGGRRRRE